MTTRARDYARGGWRDGEVWLDSDEMLWFREVSRAVKGAVPVPLVPVLATAGPLALPAPALPARSRPAPRRRRWSAERKRRFATRFVPAVALVVGSAATLPVIALRPDGRSPAVAAQPAPVTVAPAVRPADVPTPLAVVPAAVPAAGPETPAVTKTYPAIRWRESQAVGVPHAGRLVAGVKLPAEGPDWVTWDPVRHSVPNRANRLYGTDGLVRTLVAVLRDYHAAHPEVSRVLVGDLSLRGGGEIDEHVSHENGLDVDVYYPRRDGKLRPPATPAQVDRRHAQDLLDRFVAAGAQVVFVGHSSGLRGPRGVVIPYPNHENHMHVRFAPSRA